MLSTLGNMFPSVITLPLTKLIISGLVKIYLVLLNYILVFSFFGSINHIKLPNFTFPLISEQRDYFTRSSSNELLQIPPWK